jgi:hypothetical protein
MRKAGQLDYNGIMALGIAPKLWTKIYFFIFINLKSYGIL